VSRIAVRHLRVVHALLLVQPFIYSALDAIRGTGRKDKTMTLTGMLRFMDDLLSLRPSNVRLSDISAFTGSL